MLLNDGLNKDACGDKQAEPRQTIVHMKWMQQQ
jgi:hypothetical protein